MQQPNELLVWVRIHFDLVRDAIAFDEYARTAPVVTISSQTSTAASGWYNAATLGGQGAPAQGRRQRRGL